MPDLLDRFDGQQFDFGILPDYEGQSAPMFVDGQNINFEARAAMPILGQSVLFVKPKTEFIHGIYGVTIGPERTLFYGSESNLRKWTEAGGVVEVGSGYTGINLETVTEKASKWSFGRWGDWVVATNGKDAPQIWKGNLFSNLETEGEFNTCEHFLRFDEFLLALETDNPDKRIAWADKNSPERWTPARDRSAGNLPVRNLDSGIRAVGELPSGPVFFTSNSMHTIQFVGAPFYFGTDHLLDGAGVVGKHAIAVEGGVIYGMSMRGIWRTDGTRVDFIDDGFHDYVYDDINMGQLSKVTAWNNIAEKMIVFYYPGKNSSNCDRGFGVTYPEGQFTPLTYARSAADNSGLFETAITGDCVGNIYRQSLEGAPAGAVGEGTLPLSAEASMVWPVGYGGVGRIPVGGRLTVEG